MTETEKINDINNIELKCGFVDEIDQRSIGYVPVPRNVIFKNPPVKDEYDLFYTDFLEIERFYYRYHKGTRYFISDHLQRRLANDGIEYTDDFKPSCMHYRKIANLINKQARFLFGKEPDINLNLNIDLGDNDDALKKALDITREMMDNIIRLSSFTSKLFIASKDCAIGKRVACVVNFNPDSGITIDFLPAFNFVFEYDKVFEDKLSYFAYFRPLTKSSNGKEIKYFVKKVYRLTRKPLPPDQIENEYSPRFEYGCNVQEMVYDEKGEDITKEYEREYGKLFKGDIELPFIPAEVIINNGLLDETLGISDVRELEDYEAWYNALSCLDMDALRKAMNPTKYTVDMDESTTVNMSNNAGAYVDLMSDKKDPESKSPSIGLLESQLRFSEPLKDLLSMVNKEMYNFVDVPDIDLETMSGVITSGKALRALYWGLIIRCEEKMKIWAPAISRIMTIVLEGCYAFPQIAQRYLGNQPFPSKIDYEFEVIRNNPLPEDEDEEKSSDMQEVNAGLMSRKSYIMKWRNFNEAQAEEEIIQLAIESNIIDNAAIPDSAVQGNALYERLVADIENNDPDGQTLVQTLEINE